MAKDFVLKQLCIGATELYDVYYRGELVGRIRERYGRFTATYIDVAGNCDDRVLEGDTGFGWANREADLTASCLAFKAAYENDGRHRPPDDDGTIYEIVYDV